MSKKYDYEKFINKQYGKLIIDDYEKNGKSVYFNCTCECGLKKRVLVYNVINGRTTSCGCVQREKSTLSHKKYNKYDLTGEFGIGWTTNTNEEFYFDLEDYDLIKDYCWSSNENGYLRANDLLPFSRKHIRMHRLIMNKLEEDGLVIDHINHNVKDNRKCNLRVCEETDNGKNKKLSSSNTTGVTGVSFDKRSGKYEAYITMNYKRKSLGYFTTIEKAAKARKEAEEKYFREYSYDNSIEYAEQYSIN